MTIKSAIAAACMAAFVLQGPCAHAQAKAQSKAEELAIQLEAAKSDHGNSGAGVEVFVANDAGAVKVVSWSYRRPSTFSIFKLTKNGSVLDLNLDSGRTLAIHLNCLAGASLDGLSIRSAKLDPTGKQVEYGTLVADAPGYYLKDRRLTQSEPSATYQIVSNGTVIGTLTTSPGEAWNFSKGLNSSVVFVPGERMRFGSRVLNFAVHETADRTIGLSSFAYVGDRSSDVGLGMGLSVDFLFGRRTRETGAQRPIILTLGAGIQGFELNKSTGTGKFFIAAGISIGF